MRFFSLIPTIFIAVSNLAAAAPVESADAAVSGSAGKNLECLKSMNKATNLFASVAVKFASAVQSAGDVNSNIANAFDTTADKEAVSESFEALGAAVKSCEDVGLDDLTDSELYPAASHLVQILNDFVNDGKGLTTRVGTRSVVVYPTFETALETRSDMTLLGQLVGDVKKTCDDILKTNSDL